MHAKKGKSINSLMRHIRQCHINISGSNDKKQLIIMGYYHGYKGYRFYRTIRHPFQGITDFSQIVAIANFDQQIKAIFYPITMQFENVVKNVIVSKIVYDIDPSFDNIFKTKLIYYRSTTGRERYNAVNKRLRFKKNSGWNHS